MTAQPDQERRNPRPRRADDLMLQKLTVVVEQQRDEARAHREIVDRTHELTNRRLELQDKARREMHDDIRYLRGQLQAHADNFVERMAALSRRTGRLEWAIYTLPTTAALILGFLYLTPYGKVVRVLLRQIVDG